MKLRCNKGKIEFDETFNKSSSEAKMSCVCFAKKMLEYWNWTRALRGCIKFVSVNIVKVSPANSLCVHANRGHLFTSHPSTKEIACVLSTTSGPLLPQLLDRCLRLQATGKTFISKCTEHPHQLSTRDYCSGPLWLELWKAHSPTKGHSAHLPVTHLHPHLPIECFAFAHSDKLCTLCINHLSNILISLWHFITSAKCTVRSKGQKFTWSHWHQIGREDPLNKRAICYT